MWGSQVPKGCGNKGDCSGTVVQIPAGGSGEPQRREGGHEEGLASASASGLPSSHTATTQKQLSGWCSEATRGTQEHLHGQGDQKLVPLFSIFYDLERKVKTFTMFLNAKDERLFQNYLLKL